MSHERHNLFVHLAEADFPFRCAGPTHPRVSSPADTIDSPLHSRRQDASAPAIRPEEIEESRPLEQQQQANAKRNAQSRV